MTQGHNAEVTETDVDVVIVGAGFAGLYAVHRFRHLGYTVTVFEAGSDLGGTWYWNRYPGARVDIPSVDYMYSFDPHWRESWRWSEKYATQPEILRYLNHVADKFDLRRDIIFDTRVQSANWDDAASLWQVRTESGEAVRCRFLVLATGCLSIPKEPDIDGLNRFTGEIYQTSRWPHDGVDFTGKRVAVIGTGSSGIQSIPLIAQQARELVVFQRTPCFSIPAHNGPPSAQQLALLDADEPAYRDAARLSSGGVPQERSITPTFAVPASMRRQAYENLWAQGELLKMFNVYADVMSNQAANDALADFIRDKIRAAVSDPQTADTLSPTTYPVGAKRLCLDSNYFATFNRPNVRLVDLRSRPLRQILETGISTGSAASEEIFELDAIVLATGFDALTGAIAAIEITGRDGVVLTAKWAQGPSTYLGLSTTGFPNLFFITGPGSPSVLSNMAVSIEQHVDWVADCLADLRSRNLEVIEPTEVAEAGWMQHVDDCAAITLFPLADSWYRGANIAGKPRVFMPYTAGVDFYRQACDEVVARNYLGFKRSGPGGVQCEDGVVRRLQPDVQMVLDQVAALNLPPLESRTVEDARAFITESDAQRPPGPEVGDIVDGVLPGGAGELAYRLYRPPTPGPHPIVVYFHGGGWVLGDAISDDPLCRDLCVRSGAIIVSVNYRHAPEHAFPAAVHDAFAALEWVAEKTTELGGIAGQLVVGGWSAGGNLATVVCHLARENGGPMILGQALLTPVTDSDLTRGSYLENAEGYGLTTALMRWFHTQYSDPAMRTDPRLAPLRTHDLAGLPPAIVVTAQFDPLRDEGVAYAAALAGAGVPTTHLHARGHTHLSLTMVDIVPSGEPIRAQLADAVRRFTSVAPAHG